MATKKQRRLDFERSQNIALLSILTKNPASVTPNTCPSQIQNGNKGARVLSFSRESHLAEALAFIAGISDNSDHVTALCLEELSSGSGLRVVVAVNRGNHGNPSDDRMLVRVKSGLEAVFHLVARASKKHDPALEEQILDAIIDLCRDRIFSRIKSRRKDVSYSKKGKESARSRLERIISVARKHPFKPGVRPSDVGSFIRQTERFQDALIEVETTKWASINRSLKRLTVTACSLHRGRMAINMEGIIDDLQTSKDLTSNDGPTFQRLVKKLARYRECAAYLFRRAKDNKLFRNVVVMPVSLREEFFIRTEEVLDDQCLTNCVARCRNEAGGDTFKARSRVTALKELGGREFFPALKRIFKEARIHAEIQIVAHYELHPAAIPPRVIKSSKDACYLCHEFLKAHKKFYTSRTHERLYPAWKLPSMVAFNGVQTQMNKVLQARIWLESAEYAETRVAKEAVQVDESEIGSLSPMSSLASFGLLAESAGPSKQNRAAEVAVAGFGEVVSINKQIVTPPTQQAPLEGEIIKEPAGVHGEKPPTSQPGKEGEHADEIPGTEAKVDSSSQRDPLRRPSPLAQILDDEPPGEETTSHEQPPLAEQVQSTPEAITTDQDVQPEMSQSSLPSSEDQGRSQGASTPQEAGDGQLATAQTSPEPEPEPEPERNPDLESKAHQSGRESRLEAEPESLSEGFGSELAPPQLKEFPALPSAGPSSPSNITQDPGLPSSDPKATSGTSHTHFFSRTRLNPRLEHDPAENRINKQVEEERQDDQAERILIQGEPSICILSERKMSEIPIYRNGRNGKLVVHPEYIITRTSSSSRSNGETVELRITWLLPSLSPSPSISPPPSLSSSRSSSPPSSSSSSPSQSGPQQQRSSLKSSQRQRQRQNNQLQEQKLVDEDKRKDKGKGKGKGRIPEFLAESIPTCEDLDTGGTDFVRLIEADGEAVLVEVIRT